MKENQENKEKKEKKHIAGKIITGLIIIILLLIIWLLLNRKPQVIEKVVENPGIELTQEKEEEINYCDEAYVDIPYLGTVEKTENNKEAILKNPISNKDNYYLVYTFRQNEEIVYQSDYIEPGQEERVELENGLYELNIKAYSMPDKEAANGMSMEVEVKDKE